MKTKTTKPRSLKTKRTRKPKRDNRRRPCLVNVITGERTYGSPGMSEDLLFGLMANGMLD